MRRHNCFAKIWMSRINTPKKGYANFVFIGQPTEWIRHLCIRTSLLRCVHTICTLYHCTGTYNSLLHCVCTCIHTRPIRELSLSLSVWERMREKMVVKTSQINFIAIIRISSLSNGFRGNFNVPFFHFTSQTEAGFRCLVTCLLAQRKATETPKCKR